MSAKQAINNELQGSVAAYLKCGGVVNNQIKKGSLLSVTVKKIFKSVNIFPLIWLAHPPVMYRLVLLHLPHL